MGTMKVILTQDIPNLGEEGDVKQVRRGYARNYLLPKNMVVDYSRDNVKELDSNREYLEKKKLEKRENADQLKVKLEEVKIKIRVPSGDKGRLYGTVTNSNIADELKNLEYNIDKKNIDLKEHVKFGGKYKYRIHIYQDIYAEMELEVEAYQEKKEAPAKQQKRKKFNRTPNFHDDFERDFTDAEKTGEPAPAVEEAPAEETAEAAEPTEAPVEETAEAAEPTEAPVEETAEAAEPAEAPVEETAEAAEPAEAPAEETAEAAAEETAETEEKTE